MRIKTLVYALHLFRHIIQNRLRRRHRVENKTKSAIKLRKVLIHRPKMGIRQIQPAINLIKPNIHRIKSDIHGFKPNIHCLKSLIDRLEFTVDGFKPSFKLAVDCLKPVIHRCGRCANKNP